MKAGLILVAFSVLMVLTLAQGLMLAEATRPPAQPFTLKDQDWLRTNWPAGHFIPSDRDRENAHFYQVCIDGTWHRFYPNGMRTNEGTWCWR